MDMEKYNFAHKIHVIYIFKLKKNASGTECSKQLSKVKDEQRPIDIFSSKHAWPQKLSHTHSLSSQGVNLKSL